MTDKREDEEIELFDTQGHLTNQAFNNLIEGILNPEQSLEVSEHLSFCDQCILQYTSLLCGSDEEEITIQTPQLLAKPVTTESICLLSPPYSLVPSVMRQIKKRARIFYINKFASLAVAASFALVFWVGGVFTVNITDHSKQFLNQVNFSTQKISQSSNELTDSFIDALNELQKAMFEFQGKLQKIIISQ